MSGSSRDRLAPVLTEAPSWMSDRSAFAFLGPNLNPYGLESAQPDLQSIRVTKGMHLRQGLLPPAHHCPQGRTPQGLAQARVGPQTSHDSGGLVALGEQPRHEALGLGPERLGLAAGLVPSC